MVKMAERLTGSGAKFKMTGTQEDIDRVLEWFKNPVFTKPDLEAETIYLELSRNFFHTRTSPWKWNKEKPNAIEYFNDYLDVEGCSLDLWKMINVQISRISPELKINSKAQWWNTVTGSKRTHTLEYKPKSGWKGDLKYTYF